MKIWHQFFSLIEQRRQRLDDDFIIYRPSTAGVGAPAKTSIKSFSYLDASGLNDRVVHGQQRHHYRRDHAVADVYLRRACVCDNAVQECNLELIFPWLERQSQNRLSKRAELRKNLFFRGSICDVPIQIIRDGDVKIDVTGAMARDCWIHIG